MLAKGRLGERWRRLFTGDPEGARCSHHLPNCSSPAPYTLTELKNEVILEIHVCIHLGWSWEINYLVHRGQFRDSMDLDQLTGCSSQAVLGRGTRDREQT